MMNIPSQLKYTRSHEWIKALENGCLQVGVTDYAQDSLGDLVFVNLPQAGDEVTRGESFADVESVKAVSDIYSPVTGKVRAVNEMLMDSPEAINEDPYGSWLVELEPGSDQEELLDAAAYEAFCAEEE